MVTHIMDGGERAGGLPKDYVAWQQALAGYFWAGETSAVLMFVDDGVLAAVRPDTGHPAADLAGAVAQVMSLDGPVEGMFRQLVLAQGRWVGSASDGPPPTLPVLALSVLAAARMDHDADASSANYYLRLAQVILPRGSPAALQDLRVRLGEQGAFLQLVRMWEHLQVWARGSGNGTSTIRTDGRLTRIGYPMSQALLRGSDRAVLTEFFADLDLPPGFPPPDGGGLVELFRLWAARPRGLGPALQRALDGGDFADLLQGQLAAAAAAWDGVVVTREGLPRLQIRLVVDLDSWQARWAVGATTAVRADRLTWPGHAVEIAADGDRPFYRISGILPPVTPAAVSGGLRMPGSGCIAEFRTAALIVFREDPDAGAWVSCSGVEPFAEHLIAASAQHSPHVRGVLERVADPGWRVVPQAPGSALLAGWTLFEGVVVGDPKALVDALSGAAAGLRAAGLAPGVPGRPRLSGGLPLLAGLARNAYLEGGAPDLELPVGDAPRHVPVSLDGVTQQPPFLAAGYPIPLRRVIGLAAGRHQVLADRQVLTFEILPAHPAPGTVVTGTLGWDREGCMTSDLDQATVIGVLVQGRANAGEPVMCRRGASGTWLISRDGQCHAVPEPAMPAVYAAALPGVMPLFFETSPPAGTAWLAQHRAGKWQVRQVRPEPPGFRRLDEQSRRVWAAVAAHGPDNSLWLSYTRSWESHRVR